MEYILAGTYPIASERNVIKVQQDAVQNITVITNVGVEAAADSEKGITIKPVIRIRKV